jgi:hypothetical protein
VGVIPKRIYFSMWNPLRKQAEQWGWKFFFSSVPCSAKETIVVAGVAWSGTAWLAELATTLPGY